MLRLHRRRVRCVHELTPPAQQAGFTFIELIFALVMLGSVSLAVSSMSTKLVTNAGSTELRGLATQEAHARVSEILVDPRYGDLEWLYAEDGVPLERMPGLRRTTQITTVRLGKTAEYKRISVTVDGPMLESPIRRSAQLGAP